ncbi:unnamed protein product [Clonostachys rosea]|uniref:Uncharacterized protein n=1 Tax=Bionectria ochroleuca TaxID=29856 RepID=A0ABY6U6H6_BIOOC|nr:unnamed protein product [Clonostachys rosea]
MGPELQILKKISRDPQCQLALPDFKPQRKTLKAVKYAASSWLMRSKLGIAHLQATAALKFGGHVLVTAYEGGWWLYLRPDLSSQLAEGEVAENCSVLDELFREISEEMSDQGICSDPSQAHAATLPLDFYFLLMRKWVWPYSSVMAQNMKNFGTRLAPR